MDEKKVQELLQRLDDPNLNPLVKDTIREGLEQALAGGFKNAYESQLKLRARTDLDAFSEYVFGYRPMPHHREITKVLQDPNKKEVLIVAPPGSAKSTYTSQIFPPWYIGNNPEHASILLSSSSSQSIKFSTDIRSVVVANDRYKEVFPEIEIDPLKGESREQIYVKRHKQYPHANLYAAGMKSSKVLGSRAHLIVVDDPTTEILARSELELNNQKAWFENTLMTRLIPESGRIVVILTRWHNNDLASMLMNKLHFEVVHMPALGDEEGFYVDYMPALVTKDALADLTIGEDVVLNYDDPMTGLPSELVSDYQERLEEMYDEERAKGNKLDIVFSHPNRRPALRKRIREDKNPSIWPEYFKEKSLKAIRVNKGSVHFNLLYQGDPTSLEGDIFRRDWFEYYGTGADPHGNETVIKKVPDDAVYFMSVDPAISQKASADYFVVAVMARDKAGNIYVVHVLRTKLEAPDQIKAIKKLYKDKYPQTVWVLVETIAYQQGLFQTLIQEGIPCRQYRPKAGKDKEMRARSASVFYEAGKVYHPVNAPWLGDYEDELTSFPRAAKDDQVDAVSALLEEISLLSDKKPITYQLGFG